MSRRALFALLLSACWVDNQGYRPSSDAHPGSPDLAACPSYAAGGGGGLGRPQVLVPGGTYRIDGTSYPVADFYLDVFLVTVAAYRECVQADTGGCSAPLQVGACDYTTTPGSVENNPVNCVTQAQAQAFCRWAGRRLPGEGEWQYAAAGSRMSTYPWGDTAPQLGADGGSGPCSSAGTTTATCPVGSYDKTLLGGLTCNGVADLAGDLWEWTQTAYQDPYLYPEAPCGTTSAACSLRGGAFSNSDGAFFTTTFRYSFDPTFGLSSFGFRCAQTSQASAADR